MTYLCCDQLRKEAADAAGFNGIDYVEVRGSDVLVFFLTIGALPRSTSRT